MPGFVPVTLAETVTVTGPLTVLPELGVVKQRVTVYVPDGGVLEAQGFASGSTSSEDWLPDQDYWLPDQGTSLQIRNISCRIRSTGCRFA